MSYVPNKQLVIYYDRMICFYVVLIAVLKYFQFKLVTERIWRKQCIDNCWIIGVSEKEIALIPTRGLPVCGVFLGEGAS